MAAPIVLLAGVLAVGLLFATGRRKPLNCVEQAAEDMVTMLARQPRERQLVFADTLASVGVVPAASACIRAKSVSRCRPELRAALIQEMPLWPVELMDQLAILLNTAALPKGAACMREMAAQKRATQPPADFPGGVEV